MVDGFVLYALLGFKNSHFFVNCFKYNFVGAAQCLGELYRYFGRRITSGLLETTMIATKLIKFHEVLPSHLQIFVYYSLPFLFI